MLDLGAQPEAVEALVKQTRLATEKRRARAVEAVEKLRQVRDMTDDFALDILTGEAIPFVGFKTGAVVFKAKHRPRNTDKGTVRT